jgi:prepilin signal peptidase PulO-like enzyme (type II secretory pathway)
VFFFGSIVGSFLNVLVLRWGTGEPIARGRSRCFSCGKNLTSKELVPILSFLAQKGRCRNCGSKISWQYPIVEAVTGFLFLYSFRTFFVYNPLFNPEAPYPLAPALYLGLIWVILALLVAISVYDFHHQIIPNFFVYTFNFFAFFVPVAACFSGNSYFCGVNDFLEHFIAGVCFFAFFAFFWLVTRGGGMGLGDAKLALGLGWILGAIGSLSTLVFSFWFGGIASLFLLLLKRSKFTIKSRIPFTPFLIFGFLIPFLFGIFITDIFDFANFKYFFY